MIRAGEVAEVKNVAHDSATDYRGNPPDKASTGGWLAAGLILVAELAERIVVMGISMNLVTYLVSDLHLSSSKSATIVTNFMGTLHVLALVGGFLADAKLGRFATVAVSAVVTALGVGLLTVATSLPSMRPPACGDLRANESSCITATGAQLAMLYVSLYTIAVGAGSLKANVSGFGTDQFDVIDPKEEKSMIFFFNRFYFCISIGSLFAVTVLVYLQDNVGRGVGYGISAGLMAAAVAVLLAGFRKYRYKTPQGSPMTVVWRVIHLSWKKRKLPLPSDPSELHQYLTSDVSPTQKFRCLDKAAIVEKVTGSTTSEIQECSSVSQVEEVKMIVKLLPIWSTCILFWTIYSQMTTFSVEQATYMNRRITSSFVFPSGSIPVFLFITVLLFTSLNEKLVVPFARTFVTHSVQGITSLQRISIGLIFSVLAMVVSAVVENKRRHSAVEQQTDISVFWLVPQFFLVGAGEAFAYVGQLEFFIREAPERMKSMSTALFLTTLAMGFFLSSLLVSLVDAVTGGTWIRNNLNKGRLDYFYLMLAVLGVLNFVIFLVFARAHQYKQLQLPQKDGGWKVSNEEELKVCAIDVDVAAVGKIVAEKEIIV